MELIDDLAADIRHYEIRRSICLLMCIAAEGTPEHAAFDDGAEDCRFIIQRLHDTVDFLRSRAEAREDKRANPDRKTTGMLMRELMEFRKGLWA